MDLNSKALAPLTFALLLVSALLNGCVSKSEAQAQARIAYLAGQRDALKQMQQSSQGQSVTFLGPVNNPVVAWREGLMLGQAIVAAGYNVPSDPKSIVIRRSTGEIQVDPKRLLQGEDVPLEAGDIIEFRQQ